MMLSHKTLKIPQNPPLLHPYLAYSVDYMGDSHNESLKQTNMHQTHNAIFS